APLAKDGAISKIQFLKQQQQVDSDLAEVEKSIQEQIRLKLAINEAQSKAQSILAFDRKDLLERLAANHKNIAQIDSQLTKVLVENNKRIAEIDSQLSSASLNLQYQDITAPESGVVFDMQVHNSGFVATTSQPILKIVPGDALTAKVFITNRDIGFVRAGMDVDVRIESFPFSEFGDVKGKLVWIGSDALPPDEVYPFYRFPAKVKLERQSLLVNGREIVLQSGMGISTNIKVRSRTVMSIFTDLFAKNAESLKFVR
ncbi:MAG: HlyD family efflux transporter periplasmic adaptor subunit, partial [Tatlockia sp.]|nr:HlyD family efflux transporter periplasmic adaptor subunit [Tatlockia sp.]